MYMISYQYIGKLILRGYPEYPKTISITMQDICKTTFVKQMIFARPVSSWFCQVSLCITVYLYYTIYKCKATQCFCPWDEWNFSLNCMLWYTGGTTKFTAMLELGVRKKKSTAFQ